MFFYRMNGRIGVVEYADRSFISRLEFIRQEFKGRAQALDDFLRGI